MGERSGEDVDDREGSGGFLPRLSGLQVEVVELEVLVEQGRLSGVESGLQVGEVEALEGRFGVKFPRLSVGSDAVPIEQAVGGVAVLLDLCDEAACADGVAASAGDEEGVTGANWYAVEDRCGVPFREERSEGFWGEVRCVESGEHVGIGCRIEDVPGLGFWFTAEARCDGCGGVDLHGERVGGIEKFEQEREVRGWVVFEGGPEDWGAEVPPEIVERGSLEWAVRHDGLVVWAVADFPGFTDGMGVWREGSAEDTGQPSAAPDALLEQGREGEGGVESGIGEHAGWVSCIADGLCNQRNGIVRT